MITATVNQCLRSVERYRPRRSAGVSAAGMVLQVRESVFPPPSGDVARQGMPAALQDGEKAEQLVVVAQPPVAEHVVGVDEHVDQAAALGDPSRLAAPQLDVGLAQELEERVVL